MRFTVRDAHANDVPAIKTVYLRAWRAAYDGTIPGDALGELAESRREAFDWRHGIDHPNSAVFVAVDPDGVVLGVTQADVGLDPPLHAPFLTMLYVDPEAWGTGVASDLHRTALNWIGSQGHNIARLRVVGHHHRARAFYEREGWSVDPTRGPDQTDLAQLVYYRRDL
jgi:GNAT superfamily N-acetyltransferase